MTTGALPILGPLLATQRVKRSALFAAPVLAAGVFVLIFMLGTRTAPTEGGSRASVKNAHSHLPLAFEPNRGQALRGVGFLARGAGYELMLRPAEALFALGGGGRLRMKLAGGDPQARLRPQELLPGKVNYLLGNDRSRWLRGIETYARVTAVGVYPGIDLVYRGTQGLLEYDFVVRPGAEPSRISLAFDGADRIRLDGSGSLVLELPGGTLRQLPPSIYQQIDGERRPVAGGFQLEGDRVTFSLGAYDRSRALVIDPVLAYSTYLGGPVSETGTSIAVDAAGSAYVAGYTDLPELPSVSLDSPALGRGDVFVMKLNANGNALVYTTYFGGTEVDRGLAVALDNIGAAFVTGFTHSPDFPVTSGAFDTSDHPGADAFVTKLDSAGSVLVYSTYLGGNAYDEGSGIHVDGATGSATVSGSTVSSDFPATAGAYDTSPNGSSDGFVARLNPSGSAPLVYSTHLGGSGNDYAQGVDVDDDGSAYVAGRTESATFPTVGAFDSSFNGATDAYAAKLGATGATLAYSTYLGGGGIDQAFGVTVDPVAKAAYLVGQTDSNNFPTTAGAHDTTLGGSTDAFATKLTAAGSELAYSTYLGGGGADRGSAVAVDAGLAHVAGETTSTDFPTASPSQTGNAGFADAFVSRFNQAGTALGYSTYLGGTVNDRGFGIAVDQSAADYITGRTSSSDFPTQNAAQPMSGGDSDAFATKLSITTAALLRSFSARRAGANAVLRWRTGSEVGLLGFNVFGDRRGLRIRLNRILISAAGGVAGQEYSFRTPSRMTRYWLQEVRVDGSRAWRGPAKAR